MRNRIRDLRCEKGITQLRLSIELGVTQETISAYETGKHLPSLSSLLKLSHLFHASMDYIMGLSDIRLPEREADLRDDEVLMLEYYRKLKIVQKEKAVSYLQGMTEGEIKSRFS